MVIAQAITEYGIISSLMATAADSLGQLEYSLLRVDTSTWLMVAAGALVLWLVLSRRR